MPLTRDFRQTVKNRAERDKEFRNALLTEALEAIVGGELDIAKALLRDYINATEGFETVSRAVEIPRKSLMRMLGDWQMSFYQRCSGIRQNSFALGILANPTTVSFFLPLALSRSGNPNTKNLFGITRYLQNSAGLKFKVVAVQQVAKSKKKRVATG